MIPKDHDRSSIDIWFQYEARFGQQNTTTRLWAEKGSKPRAVRQQQCQYAYLFGAICPATGATEAIVTPYVNKEAMAQHLQQISQATPTGRHAVVIMDGAGWHTDDTAFAFNNITLVRLPAYSPELNPVEQIWQWLRQNELANKCFEGYEDIVNSCCDAWNNFVSDSERVKGMCMRGWMNLGV